MKIKFALDKGAFAPEKAHGWDAGFDIKTPVAFEMAHRSCVVIDTGLHVEIPEGYVGVLMSKSGLNVKYGITSEGVIDAGYSGTIRVKLYRYDSIMSRDNPKTFDVGDKISQLVILPIPEVEMVQVDEIDAGERGDNGFGSSGR